MIDPMKEIQRLKEQEERVLEKLNENPEIMEALDKLTADEIRKAFIIFLIEKTKKENKQP